MNLEKLKDTARKHEQKEDWRKAIDVYQKAIQHFEAGRESELDLALYNRVGDLYLKLNDPGSAVQSYERAADLYGEQGFLNNAIALCGKVLRVNPGRVQVYLKLAHLHARKNVVSETKRNLIEYIERMNTLGKLDEAFVQVKTFADQHSGNHDIRMMLVELLRASSRTDEAREQLEKMAGELEARGDRAGARKTRERMNAIHAEESATEAVAGKNDLVFIETGIEGGFAQRGVTSSAPIAGLETSTAAPDEMPAPPAPLEGLDTFQPPPPIAPAASADLALIADFEPGAFIGPSTEIPQVDGLLVEGPGEPGAGLLIERTEHADLILDASTGSALDLDPAFETAAPELDADVPDTFNLLPDADLETPSDALVESGGNGEFTDSFAGGAPIELESRVGAGLDFIVTEDRGDIGFYGPETESEPGWLVEAGAGTGGEVPGDSLTTDTVASDELTALEDRILENPEDPALHRALGDALVPAGDPARAIEEYALALTGYEAAAAWESALDAVDAILGLEPDAIRYQQKRVELAYRSGDRARLLSAYLDLADALVRAEAVDKAAAVYGRILEHDPGNARARAAMADLAPAPPADAPRAPTSSPPAAAHPPAASGPAPIVAPPASGAPPESRRAASPPPGYVDLRSMIVDEEGPRDTRMKIDNERPTGDEQKDFLETLAQFKKGIEANLGTEDYEAHYDLGIAFKEMGLLDEAIAEFQKALRAPNGRMRTSEALGVTFFEKQQYAIAETILRRAVDSLEGGDDDKIGLLYWLGRSCEAQGRANEARASYERALAVDIRFMDLGERVQRLTRESQA